MREILEQLKNPNYRFFLAPKNSKIAFEPAWNTKNCYMFFEPKLLTHLRFGNNIGICTGINSLIVIDFDDKEYQDLKVPFLPPTFTVLSAGKRLKHLYYHLIGEMIAKVGVDKHVLNGLEMSLNDYQMLKAENSPQSLNILIKLKKLIITRRMDIQAAGNGICCPPSSVDGRLYSVVNDVPIANIECSELMNVFSEKTVSGKPSPFGGIEFSEKKKSKNFRTDVQPDKIQHTLDVLEELGVIRTNTRHYKCPFHNMAGAGNLFVGDSGHLHCFNCNRHWNTVEGFREDMKR